MSSYRFGDSTTDQTTIKEGVTDTQPFPWVTLAIVISTFRLFTTIKYGREAAKYRYMSKRRK